MRRSGSPGAGTQRCAITEPDGFPDCDVDTHRHSDGNYGPADGDANRHGDCYALADSYAQPHRHGYAITDCYAGAHP